MLEAPKKPCDAGHAPERLADLVRLVERAAVADAR